MERLLHRSSVCSTLPPASLAGADTTGIATSTGGGGGGGGGGSGEGGDSEHDDEQRRSRRISAKAGKDVWIRCTQPGHDEFFYNQASQRSSWTQGDKAIREALKGEEWVECASDDGRNYFVNLLDNRSSWTDHRSQAALAAALAEVHGGGGGGGRVEPIVEGSPWAGGEEKQGAGGVGGVGGVGGAGGMGGMGGLGAAGGSNGSRLPVRSRRVSTIQTVASDAIGMHAARRVDSTSSSTKGNEVAMFVAVWANPGPLGLGLAESKVLHDGAAVVNEPPTGQAESLGVCVGDVLASINEQRVANME